MPDIDLGRILRKQPTWAEKLMWRWLRGRRFNGYKFRRQHPVGKYWLDFFCEEARLSVELDGSGHGHPEQQAHDAERANFLETQGIRELRFWNSRLRREAESIRTMIFNALQERAPHPLPDYARPMLTDADGNAGPESRPRL
jgi:ATP-dependent helicase HrpA/adenine-specific DNA-methyltransferase